MLWLWESGVRWSPDKQLSTLSWPNCEPNVKHFWSCFIGSANVAGAPNMSVREDDIDILLDKLDGKIQRQRDETM